MHIAFLSALRPLAFGTWIASAFSQAPSPVPPKTPTLTPTFQVATIKPSEAQESRSIQIRGVRFATTDTSVFDLLEYAYGIHEQQILGGPQWIATQKFDLMCDPETETRPSSDDFKKMVQLLLADRFHLVTHREMRDLSGLEIHTAKDGARLSKSVLPSNGLPLYGYSQGHLRVSNATMADFAADLQRFVTDRPVFDETGLTGKYDLNLQWNPDDAQLEGSHESNDKNQAFPDLYTAIQEQLGLRLQPTKRPTPVLIIDHADTPSEN
jgi:uncharacterized protein (TIGR03435 family)